MEISKVIKSPQELEEFKEMLVQDAESDGSEAIFEGNEVMDFPCLVKVRDFFSFSQVYELEDEPENTQEAMENIEPIAVQCCTYEFTTITQKEILELMEA